MVHRFLPDVQRLPAKDLLGYSILTTAHPGEAHFATVLLQWNSEQLHETVGIKRLDV